MSNIDPHLTPFSPKDLGRRLKWIEDRLKYLSSGRGFIERASVSGGSVTLVELLSDPGKGREFFEDSAVATTNGVIVIVLTHLPLAHSEHVYWDTDYQPATEWTRDGLVLTLTEPHIKAGEHATVEYAYDPTDVTAVPNPRILVPTANATTTDSTPTISGTAAPLRSINVLVDGASVAMTTSAADGSWSVTSTTLTIGGHTITASGTNPDGSVDWADPVIFSVVSPLPATVTARANPGTFAWGTNSGGGGTGLPIPLPAGTVVGDLIVVSAISAGAISISDPRLTFVGNNMWIGWATNLSSIAVGLVSPWFAVTCDTFATNATGWTAAQVASDGSIAPGGTIPTPVIAGVSAVICATTATVASFGSCSIGTPTGYTNVANTNNPLSAGINLWSTAGISTSPTGTVSYTAGGNGALNATVVGLIGP